MARSRARLLRATGRASTSGQGSGSRSTGVIIGGSTANRPLVTVPATYVPEELISQAEVVLQGKSRNLIIRELQACGTMFLLFQIFNFKVLNYSAQILM